MASNAYRKHTFEDKFARHMYCRNAAYRYTKHAKQANRRKFRRQIFRKEQEL